MRAGITSTTTQHMLVRGLVEREHASTYRLTDEGRAVLWALLGRDAPQGK